MTFTTVFTINGSQSIRVPHPVRFPERVKRVEVRTYGASRIFSPVGKTWGRFFLLGKTEPAVLLDAPAQQTQAARESL
jgi:antitoxin VapB